MLAVAALVAAAYKQRLSILSCACFPMIALMSAAVALVAYCIFTSGSRSLPYPSGNDQYQVFCWAISCRR